MSMENFALLLIFAALAAACLIVFWPRSTSERVKTQAAQKPKVLRTEDESSGSKTWTDEIYDNNVVRRTIEHKSGGETFDVSIKWFKLDHGDTMIKIPKPDWA